MKLCGHRGLASIAPENTLAGLEVAHQHGFNWVEIDVQLTQDNQVVLFHDKRLTRCTNGHGLLRQHTWQQLSQLDAGSWFSAEFAGERLVRLSDYLIRAAQLKMKVNIELKLFAQDNAAPLAQQVSLIIEQGLFNHADLLFSSFNTDTLAHMQQLQPAIARALLVERVPSDWQLLLARFTCCALHCDYQYLTQSLAHTIIQAGYQVNCYTVNHPSHADMLADWGVSMIFTDIALKQAPFNVHHAPH